MTTTEQEKKEERRAKTERGVTLFTAGIASVVAAQGMYVMFSESLNMPLPLTLLCFAFIELMVVASAMRARTSQLATGSAGVDGIAMWVLTILSGVLAASHATEDVGLLILRLAAPLVAAWGWERSMALERRQLTGRTERRTNWRISPQRLLVKWGFADPTDRTTAEVAVERRLADLARAADVVRLARSTGGGRRERRAMQRLHRAIDRAAEDGIVLGEESVRDRLAEHLEGRFSAYTLPNYHPRADWADHAAKSIRPTLDAIEVEQAVLDEFERELSAFETAVDRSPLAGEVRSVARGSLVSDGAVHAVTEAAPPASDVSEVPLATPEQTAHPVSDTDAPHADTSLVSDAANFAHEPKSLAASSGSPLAAHTVDEQGSDHGSLAAHRTEDLGFVAISEELPHAETEGAQAPTARATDVARERRAAVSLVSGNGQRRKGKFFCKVCLRQAVIFSELTQ